MSILKKYYRSAILMSVAFLIPIVGIVSCTDEDDGNGSVELFSFGPTGIKHGEVIKFIGIRLDKVTAIQLPGVEVPSSGFTTKTSKLIELIVPDEAEAGKVILKTPQGDIETKTMLSFNVPVEISAITAQAKPGTDITINGSKVNWITEVIFNDGLSVLDVDFVSKTLSELVVTVPMEAQTGFLIFKSGGTKPLSFASESELSVTLPTVTSFLPASAKHTENVTITGTDLDLVTSIEFGGNFTVFSFVSQSSTEIVVTVPAGALKGKLTLKQASPVNVVTSSELLITLPSGTNVSPKPAEPGTDNITISGTNLDLVAELSFPSVASPVLSSSFVSQSSTEIVVLVPAGTKSGGIGYKTIHGYSNTLGVNVIIPAPGPPPLVITMFDEGFAYGGGNWSWGGASDPASTEQFYAGSISFKHATSGNDGGASSGGMSGIDASGQGVYKFSIYGGPGTGGKQVAAILGSDGADKWDSYNTVTLVEGTWTEYSLPLSSYATVNFANVTRWIFKVEGATDAVIYVDRVGFDPAGPPPLALTMFDESIAFGGGNWSWGGTADPASTEQSYSGTKSFKHTTSGNDGGASVGAMSGVDASIYTVLKFSLYGGPGTDGKQVAAILGSDGSDKWDSYNSVTLVEGAWTNYSIQLTNYATVNLANVTRWIFKVEGATDAVVYVDRVGFD